MAVKEDLVSIVADEITVAAGYLGVPPRAASDLARQVADRIRLRIGGSDLRYVAKVDRRARRDAILAEFSGRNHAELAVKHKVTERWVRIITGRK